MASTALANSFPLPGHCAQTQTPALYSPSLPLCLPQRPGVSNGGLSPAVLSSPLWFLRWQHPTSVPLPALQTPSVKLQSMASATKGWCRFLTLLSCHCSKASAGREGSDFVHEQKSAVSSAPVQKVLFPVDKLRGEGGRAFPEHLEDELELLQDQRT